MFDRRLLNEATKSITVPERMRDLPIDTKRGYLIPWFVAMVPDESGTLVPDFRAIRPGGITIALSRNTCWLCGKTLGVYKTFAIGPMCAVNRTTAEPPCHKSCARYACMVCPFLTQPKMRRNEKDMPEEASEPAGVMIKRNPGVTLLWTTLSFTWQRGLISLGDPQNLEWWCQKRRATRLEVEESIISGLPLLRAECDGEDDLKLLASCVDNAMELLPAA